MRVGRTLVPVVLVTLFLVSALPTVLAGDVPRPTGGIPVLQVGSPDQMKTRNVLTSLAWMDRDTMAVLGRVYDTAVQRNATDGSVVPRLAVGVDLNGNGFLDASERGRFDAPASATSATVFYDFTNARFHDGVSVSAMDLLFSYHVWALNPMTNGPFRVLMDQGGGPSSNYSTTRWLWVLPVPDGDSDPATAALEFRPQFPYPLFAYEVLGVPVLPRHIWEGTGGGRHGDFGRAIYPEGDPRAGQGIPPSETMYTPFNLTAAQSWQLTDADVIGSGHFRFTSWAYGASVRLDSNLDYAFGRPKIDGIVFKVYRTTQLLVLALEAGEIDFILGNIAPEFLPDLQSDPRIRIVETPSSFPASLYFNLRRQPTGYDAYPPLSRSSDVGLPFRQAFAHLIDEATIVQILLQGHGLVAAGMVSPENDGWYDFNLPRYAYDLGKAAAFLDSQGWTDSNGDGWREFPRAGDRQIDILTPQADYDPIRASAGAMLAAAARRIGINVNSKPTYIGAILLALDSLDYDLVIVDALDPHACDPWTLSRGDPDYLFDLFHSSNAAAGWNMNGFWDGSFDAAADLSRRSTDYVSRDTHVKDEQTILAERLPMIPMYYRNLTWAYRADRFTGWQLISSTLFNYWSLQGLEPTVNPPPIITLVWPANGSRIRRGAVVDLEVVDSDLGVVRAVMDGGTPFVVPPPYDVSTASWPDGPHVLDVSAQDSIGNVATERYSFTVDGTGPGVRTVTPGNHSVVRSPVDIRVTFTEPVNRTSVEAAFSVEGGSRTLRAGDGTFNWSANRTSFSFTPTDPLARGTAYVVRLEGTLTDDVGNPMGPAYSSGFVTEGVRGPPLVVLLGFLFAVVAVAAIIFALLLTLVRRRRRGGNLDTAKPKP